MKPREDGGQPHLASDAAYWHFTISSCCRASRWPYALSLVSDMWSLKMDPFLSVGRVMESMTDHGSLAGAMALFREAYEGHLGSASIDLHGYTEELARVAVCVILLDASLDVPRDLEFIVGLGHNSSAGAILSPSILQLLDELDVAASLDLKNRGLLRIPREELLSFARGSRSDPQKIRAAKCYTLCFLPQLRTSRILWKATLGHVRSVLYVDPVSYHVTAGR